MVAQIYFTDDKGVSWSPVNGPFAATEDVISAVCFAVSKDTNRWLTARGVEAAPTNPAEVGYTDDSGANWDTIDVEAVGTRYASDSGALFAMDRRHIWFVTTEGYIFFSDDGGATWTTQTAGSVTTEDLHEVHFADVENGMAVGGAGMVLKTGDGGVTWSSVEVITDAPIVNAVQMIDSNTALVGTADGKIYMTFDGGDSWTEKYSLTSGDVTALHAVNQFVIWGVVNTDGPVGSVIRTRNGGYTWETVTTPTNTGLNSVHGLDANKAWAVGDDGIVVKVYG